MAVCYDDDSRVRNSAQCAAEESGKRVFNLAENIPKGYSQGSADA